MILKNKPKRKISFLIAVMMILSEILLFQDVLFTRAEKVLAYHELGPASHYNGIIFNEFLSYQADIEGALAVGGYGQFGIKKAHGYDVGAAGPSKYAPSVQIGRYLNDDGYPTLLLNGSDIRIGENSNDNNAWYNIYDGWLVMPAALRNKYDSRSPKFATYGQYAGAKIAEDATLNKWFRDQYERAVHISETMAEATEVTTTFADFYMGTYLDHLEDFYNQNLWENSSSKDNILVINIKTDNTIVINDMWQGTWPNAGNVRIYYSKALQKFDLVVFNFVDAVNVTFDQLAILDRGAGIINPNNSSAVKPYAEQILWNFPKAQNIKMNKFAMFGSVLAPYADLTADGGSINGQLICDSFTTINGMELHAFKVPDPVDEIDGGVDEPALGSVELTKYEDDFLGTSVLPGAGFRLTYKNERGYEPYDNEVYVTDENGKIFITDLPEGDYRFEEVSPPPGYQIASDEKALSFTIDENSTVEVPVYVMAANQKKVIDVRLRKMDSSGEGYLPGATFLLYKNYNAAAGMSTFESAQIMSVARSDEQGEILLGSLSEGSYTLYEIQAPAGYSTSSAAESNPPSYHFNVVLDASNDLTLSKVYDAEGNELEQINENGVYYYVVYNAKEPETIDITILKEDFDLKESGSNISLENAEFRLEKRTDDNNWYRVLDAVRTTAYGYTIKDLQEGYYRLIETKAPDGYLLSSSSADRDKDYYYIREFHVTTDGIEKAPPGEETLLILYNKRAVTDFHLEKVNSLDPAEKLSGVEFELYKIEENGSRVLKADDVTDKNGRLQFENLENGSYELIEVKAPDGFKVREEAYHIEVVIDQDGNAAITVDGRSVNDQNSVNGPDNPYIIQNEPYTGGLEVHKIDSVIIQNGVGEHTTLIKTPLEGAQFQLQRRRTDGDNKTTWEDFGAAFTTNSQGQASVTDLPLGTYRLIEVKAPEGYELPSDNGEVGRFTITLTTDGEGNPIGETVALEIKNYTKEARSRLKIKKIDAEPDDNGREVPLAGALFKLWKVTQGEEYFAADKGLDEMMAVFDQLLYVKYATEAPLRSDGEGIVDLGELTPGVYMLFESEAPDGYLYTLNSGQTVASADDPSFYNYLTIFKVVAINEDDSSQGVRIQWVDGQKIAWGEALYNNDNHNVPNTLWQKPADPNQYRMFTITNKKLESIRASLSFYKVDSESGRGLGGASFTIYQYDDETDGYTKEIGRHHSDEEGHVILGNLMTGRYYVEETKVPDGYQPTLEGYYFQLLLNPTTKLLDLYQIEEDGTIIRLMEAGYSEANGPVKEFVIPYHYKNDPITADIKLIKVDGQSSRGSYKYLAGAEFSLWKKDLAGEYQDTGKTFTTTAAAAGYVLMDGLSPGSYLLKEVKAPAGYQSGREDIEFQLTWNSEKQEIELAVVSGSAAGEHLELIIANDLLTLDVELEKIDGETGALLFGGEFSLYKKDASGQYTQFIGSQTSDSSGRAGFTRLEAGEYELRETKPPRNYQMPLGSSFFEIRLNPEENRLELHDQNGIVTENLTITIENERLKGDITIIKLDEDGQTPLGNAEFEFLYDVNGDGTYSQRISLPRTDSAGRTTISGLEAGSYKAHESVPPEGYILNAGTIRFKLVPTAENDRLVLEMETDISGMPFVQVDENTSTVTILNERYEEPTTSIFIRKIKAGDRSYVIPGAVFSLSKEVTGENGVSYVEISEFTTKAADALEIGGLTAGRYRLEELRGADGYHNEGTVIDFTLEAAPEGLKLQLTGQTDKYWLADGNEIHITNQELTAAVELFKHDRQDSARQKRLAGAQFHLYRNGDLITAGDGSPIIYLSEDTITGLTAGAYVLEEITAPDGYAAGLRFSFELHSNAAQDGLELTYENESPIAGPNGHFVVYLPNDELVGEIVLTKTDGGKAALADATFSLQKDGEGSPAIMTTDQNGSLRFTGLTAGSYTLTEQQAPDGYRRLSEPIRLELVSNEQQDGLLLRLISEHQGTEIRVDEQALAIQVTNSLLVTTVHFQKISDIFAGVGGAYYSVYKYNDIKEIFEAYDWAISGEDGSFSFNGLIVGDYMVLESRAPKGYQLSSERLYFSIRANDDQSDLTVTMDGENHFDENSVKQLMDQRLTGDVVFYKVDQDNPEIGLTGAQFTLYEVTASGYTRIGVYTSVSSVINITGLTAGSYLLQETRAATHYLMGDTPVVVTFDMVVNSSNNGLEANVTSNNGSFLIKNKRPEIDLTIEKYEAVPEGADILIAGAEFGVRTNGSSTYLSTGKTDSYGRITFSGLPLGFYELVEIAPADGYYALERSHHFLIILRTDDQGQEYVSLEWNQGVVADYIRIPNIRYGSVEIQKQDETGASMPDVEFTLSGSDGTIIDRKKTDEYGFLSFTKLTLGHYRLKETVPEGYLDNGRDIGFEVQANGFIQWDDDGYVTTDNQILIINQRLTGAITLIKFDADNVDDYLADAEFSLLDGGGHFIDSKLTDKDGRLSFTGLLPGSYTLKETGTPEGYRDGNVEVAFEVDINGQVTWKANAYRIENDTIYIGNQAITGGIDIIKRDGKEKSIRLPDTVFVVYQGNNEVVRGTTAADGSLTILGLRPGDYTLVEAIPPSGYLDERISIPFTILENGKAGFSTDDSGNEYWEISAENSHQVYVNNQRLTGGIQVAKHEQGNLDQLLAGAEFAVYPMIGDAQANEPVSTKTTTDTGVLEFAGLNPGKYVLKEVTVPSGYKPQDITVYFEIDDGGGVIWLNHDTTGSQIHIENEPILGEIEVIKHQLDKEGRLIPGAVFTLYEGDGQTFITQAITDGFGIARFSGLRVGSYVLKETGYPQGYLEKPVEIAFEISTEDGGSVKWKTSGFDTDQNQIKIPNEGAGYIEIIKYRQGDDTRFLSDAHFRVYDQQGHNAGEIITDASGYGRLENLIPGSYTLYEVQAPVGYRPIDETIGFRVLADGSIVWSDHPFNTSGNQIQIENEGIGSFQLVKYRQGDTLRTLSNAEFTLSSKDDDFEVKAVTDFNGRIAFTNLTPGSYTLEETKVPGGYMDLDIEIPLIVHNNGKIEWTIPSSYQNLIEETDDGAVIKIINVGLGSIEIIKHQQDDENNLIAGATFTVYDGDEAVAVKATDSTGKVIFDNLVSGDYRLVETKFPDGYRPQDIDIAFTIDTDGSVAWDTDEFDYEDNRIAITNEGIGRIEIIKVDEDINEILLPGAAFAIMENDREIAFGLTNEAGYLAFDNIRPGSYRLVEKAAPLGYLDSSGIAAGFTIDRDGIVTWLIDNQAEGPFVAAGNRVTVKNTPMLGEILIHKYEVGNSQKLVEGAQFVLYREGAEAGRQITAANRPLTFEDLRPGSYTLVEESPPNGYKKASVSVDFEVLVKENAIVIDWLTGGYDTAGNQISIGNERLTGSVKLYKYDQHYPSKRLTGAVFDLELWRNGTWERIRRQSTQTGGLLTFEDITLGEYRIVEYQPAAGYVDSAFEFYFSMIKDDDLDELIPVVTSGNGDWQESGNSLAIYVANAPVTGGIKLQKLDQHDGDLDERVKFEISYSQSDNPYDWEWSREIEANGEYQLSGLRAGFYKLQETEPPDGYRLLLGDVIFQMIYNDDKTALTPKMIQLGSAVSFDEATGTMKVKNVKVNEPTTDIFIHKVAADGSSGHYLEGAHFELTDLSDNTTATFITREDVPLHISGLVAGQYILKEIQAPDGYRSEDIKLEFEIKADSSGAFTLVETTNNSRLCIVDRDERTVQITNTLLLGEVIIQKEGETNDILSGAEFQLYRYNNHYYDEVKENGNPVIVTDSITGLLPGKYMLREVTAPIGYEIGDDYYFELKVNTAGTALEVFTGTGDNQIALGNDKTLVITNKLLRLDVEIIKTDSRTGETIADSSLEFKLWKEVAGAYTSEITLAKNGSVYQADNLSFGNYRLKEAKAPHGYRRLEDDIDFAIVPDDSGQSLIVTGYEAAGGGPVRITVANDAFTGEAYFRKVDAATGNGLAGAEFSLYQGNDMLLANIPSDADGEIHISGLTAGEYKLVETKACDGYLLESGNGIIFRMNVKADNTGLDFVVSNTTITNIDDDEIQIRNSKGYAEITVFKYYDALEPLGGAVFEIRNQSDELVAGPLTSLDSGKITFNKLPAGEYKLVETKAPDGFELSPDSPFGFTVKTVGDEVIVTWADGSTGAAIDIENHRTPNTGDIKVYKFDHEDHQHALAGAAFAVYRWETNELVASKVTGEDGIAEFHDLLPGNYILEETIFPGGYQRGIVSVSFTVETDGGIRWGSSPYQAQGNDIAIYNELITGSIEIIKYEKGDPGRWLDGAVFAITQNHQEIARRETVADTPLKFTGLKPGAYTLTEVKPPAGYYDAAITVDFEIVIDGNTAKVVWPEGDDLDTDNHLIRIANEQLPEEKPLGEITVTKINGDGGELSGADFLVRATGSNSGYYKEQTTNESGLAIFSDLPEGDYELVEKKAPDGYARDKTIYLFTVEAAGADAVIRWHNADGNTNTAGNITIVNESLSGGEINIVKYALANGQRVLLEGAEFAVFQGDDLICGPEETGSDGTLTFSGLPPGIYTLKETKAPGGYQTFDGNIRFEIRHQDEDEYEVRWLVKVESSGNTVYIKNEKLLGTLEILKVDSENPLIKLKGAAFTLYKEDTGKNLTGPAAAAPGRVPDADLETEESDFEPETSPEQPETKDDLQETEAEESEAEETDYPEEPETTDSSAAPEESEGESKAPDESGTEADPQATDGTSSNDGDEPSGEETATHDGEDQQSILTRFFRKSASLLKTFFFMELKVNAAPWDDGIHWNEIGVYITNEAGLVTIRDLAAGSYMLVESTPPKDYEIDGDEYFWYFDVDDEGNISAAGGSRLTAEEGRFVIENDKSVAESTEESTEESTKETTRPATGGGGGDNDDTTAAPTEPGTTTPEETSPQESTEEETEIPPLIDETSPSYPPNIPPGYSFRYDPERGEYLIYDSNGIPLGYVKSPELFVMDVPKTGDRAPVTLAFIMLTGMLAAGIVIWSPKEKLRNKRKSDEA